MLLAWLLALTLYKCASIHINFWCIHNLEQSSFQPHSNLFQGYSRGKRHLKVKLQHFRKVWIWTFEWLVHQINSLYEVPKLKQNFWKSTPFFTPSVCIFQKIYFKVNVLKSFKIFSDCHIKVCLSLKWRAILRSIVLFFRRTTFHLLALKWNL